MKILFPIALLLFALSVRAATFNATVTEAAKMEVTRGKGAVTLKPGTVVEVVSREGDNLNVVYRNIAGVIAASKTDFKGDAPLAPATSVSSHGPSKPNAETTVPPTVKPTDPKSAAAKEAAPANPENPTSNYGKMVKKARENEEKHKENLVDPVDSVTAGKKN